MKLQRNSRLATLVLRASSCALLLASATSAHATARTWAGGDGSWNDPLLWTPNGVPVAADTETLNTTGVNANETISLDADQTSNSLVIKNTGTTTIVGNVSGSTARVLTTTGANGLIVFAGAGSVSIGGSGLSLNLSGSQAWTNNSSNALNVSADLAVLTGGQWTVAGAADTNVSGVISGSGLMVKNGAGTLTLSGVNTFSNLLTVSAGTLKFSGPGTFGTGNVTISGGLVDLNGTNQTITGVPSTGGLTLGGGAAGTTANLEIGSGTLTLSAPFLTYSATNNPNGATISGTGGGRLKLNNSAAMSIIVGDSTAATTDLTIGAIVQDGVQTGFAKTGAGTLLLAGANTYSGRTLISAGALSVSSLNSVVGGTASSNLGAPTTVVNGTIALGSSTTSGTLIYTGGTTTTDRVINLAGTTGGGTIDQSGTGALKFTSNQTAVGAGIKSLTLQGSTSGTGEIAGAIVNNSGTNTTSLIKAGTGTWTLSGANTFTGGTTINGGSLLLASATTLQAATGLLTVNTGGTLASTVAATTLGSSVTLSGGTIAPSGLATVGSLTLAAGKSFTFSSGTLSLDLASGASYDQIFGSGAGVFTISGGVLDLSGTTVSNYLTSYNVLSGFTTAGSSVSGLAITGYDTSNWTASLGNNGVLAFTAVPEPTTWAMLIAGASFICLVRPRRRR